MLQAERDSAHELAAVRDDWESLRREEAHELRVHLLQNVLPQPLKWDSLFSLCSGGVLTSCCVTCYMSRLLQVAGVKCSDNTGAVSEACYAGPSHNWN